MLYGAKVAICSGINVKHIDTVWAECKILECFNLLVHHATIRL